MGASVYPTTLDTLASLPQIPHLGPGAPEGTTEFIFKELMDAIIALQAKVGVNSSAVLGSLDDLTQQGIKYQDTQLTAAQVNALVATNITVVTAPAAGFAVIPLAIYMFLDHGGTDFVQAAGTDAMALRYTASTEIQELGTQAQFTTFIEASADAALYALIDAGAFVPVTDVGLDLDNNGATEHTTGDGTLSVRVWYTTVPFAAFT
jgi:hypothetical protein